MPLTQTARTKRLELPTDLPGIDAGEWVEIATVYTSTMRQTAYDASHREDDSTDVFAFRQSIVEQAIVAWSDPSPATPQAIASLHPFVLDWISNQFHTLAGGRTDDEKKDSESSSSSGSAQGEETSPASSIT